MRSAWRGHELQETRARRGILARRALQGLDEGAQRGQRGAQLVAGVGDEVGAHLPETVLLGQIAECDEHLRPDAARPDW